MQASEDGNHMKVQSGQLYKFVNDRPVEELVEDNDPHTMYILVNTVFEKVCHTTDVWIYENHSFSHDDEITGKDWLLNSTELVTDESEIKAVKMILL